MPTVRGFNPIIKTATPEVVDVFIVAGQSNARGQNQAAGWDTFLTAYKVYIPNAFINYAYNDPPDGTKFYALDGAVDNASYRYRYVSVQYGFAKAYTEYKQRKCYIIHHAVGSTGLKAGTSTPDWSPGGTLYTTLVGRVLNAINIIKASGKTPRIVSFYWNQGEQDAQVGTVAAGSYLALLQGFFNAFKSEATINPYFYQANLNIQIALLGTWTTTANASYQSNRVNIRADQAQFAATYPNAAAIETADVDSIVGDEIHRTTPGQFVIAGRLFDNVKNLV
jgi:hypothetical protein